MHPPPVSPITRFGRLITSLGLTDAWRHLNPNSQTYSCFSSTYNTMSRIDMIVISNSLLPALVESAYSPRLLSDPSPLLDISKLDKNAPQIYTGN
ncbi:hypothetical protein GDO86_019604 [Hymenochirus boettgeri]|uniref:Uncharacterized protein n=1 Tax=Hymenochirus boettgeri TaxID=247094 RepID=A0A8T2IJN3_9PIPI|nr:hypothetical protein GDO86_019604 [Hymenochirus boettgeri]